MEIPIIEGIMTTQNEEIDLSDWRELVKNIFPMQYMGVKFMSEIEGLV
jgi:hypothetical protein